MRMIVNYYAQLTPTDTDPMDIDCDVDLDGNPVVVLEDDVVYRCDGEHGSFSMSYKDTTEMLGKLRELADGGDTFSEFLELGRYGELREDACEKLAHDFIHMAGAFSRLPHRGRQMTYYNQMRAAFESGSNSGAVVVE